MSSICGWLSRIVLTYIPDFDIRLDGLVPNTPLQPRTNSAPRRKAAFETPSISKVNKSEIMSSPSDARSNLTDGLYVARAPDRHSG